MAVSPESPSTLELTISTPGFSLPSYRPSSGDHAQEGCSVRDLDINLKPSGRDRGVYDEWTLGAANIEDEGESINGNGGAGRLTNPRKKLRLSKEQSHLLEESFKRNNTLNPKQKQELAVALKLRPRQVEVWFQNRRARSKMKQTEMECEHLKRWFSSLREQNRVLKKEVEELRAIKMSHQASTITMCPQCERVLTTAVANTAGPRLEEASQPHR